MRRLRLRRGWLLALLACATVVEVSLHQLAAAEWPQWFGRSKNSAANSKTSTSQATSSSPRQPAMVETPSRPQGRAALSKSFRDENVVPLSSPVLAEGPGSEVSYSARRPSSQGDQAIVPVQAEFVSPPPPRAPGRVPTEAAPQAQVGDGQRLKLIEFRNVPLVDAMQTFADQAGINIVASPEASKIEISVYLRNVTAKQALDAITKAHGLYYKVDETSGIVRISTTKEYRQTLADFQDEQTEVFTLLYPNPYVVALAIRNTFGERVRLGMGDMQSDQDQFQDLTQRLQRFDLIDTRNQGLGTFQNNNALGGQGQNGLNNQLGVGGRGGQLGIGGRGGQFGNQLGGGFGNQFGGGIGNQFGGGQQYNPANDLERKPLENLSAEEIFALEQARQNGTGNESLSGLLERNRASIYVSVIRRNNQLVVRTGDELIMRQIKDLVSRLDVPTPLVLLEVKVLNVSLFDGFHSVFDYQFTDGAKNAGTFGLGGIANTPAKGGNVSLSADAGPSTQATTTIPGANGAITTAMTTIPGAPATGSAFVGPTVLGTGIAASAGDLTFQYVSDSFRARMQLLEDKNRVTVMTAPLLLTANNEISRIFIGETRPITTGFNAAQTVAQQGGVVTASATAQTEQRDIGQSLLITPSINADRTVTLRIVQETSRLGSSANVLAPGAGGGLEQKPVDTVQRSTVSGTLIAKDGLTVAVGGLISDEVRDSRAEVPVLGKLPVLGFFFRRQGSGRGRTETIIMVRPYVFNTPSESAALSQQLIPELSIHPKAMDPSGTLDSFLPHEVLRPNPPANECENIFRFHSVQPKSY